MANIKPAALRTGKTGKEEIEKRKKAEEALKTDIPISEKAPLSLTKNGEKIYKEIIKLLPNGLLSAGDTWTVGIVADALDRMQTAQELLNTQGLFDEEGSERDASKSYERYSKIFDKFGSSLGLSPKSRAQLAVLNIKEEEEKQDPLLAILTQ